MKAIIEFTLPEDQDNYETANNAMKWRNVVEDLDGYLRNDLKYKDGKLTCEEIRTYLHECLNEATLSLV